MTGNPLRCDPRFRPLLDDFGFDNLEADRSVIFGLWSDLTLAYANPSWSRFAAENGGEPSISSAWCLGRCVLDAIAEPLKPFFTEHYGRCLRESRPWEHTYECSSAELFRQFHKTVFPLGQSEGLLVINSLRIEAPHRRVDHPPLESQYRTPDGIITQCCHCRRIRRAAEASHWDWVSQWVRQSPERTSHGICESCFGFYYSAARLDLEELVVPFTTIGS